MAWIFTPAACNKANIPVWPLRAAASTALLSLYGVGWVFCAPADSNRATQFLLPAPALRCRTVSPDQRLAVVSGSVPCCSIRRAFFISFSMKTQW